jgi:glutamyl-tRNA synthetase
MNYRGRIAPSPTGYLHLGHAQTFRTAWQRARDNSGALVFRMEDLDRARCKPEFVRAAYDDLRWFGLDWEEGPDCGGDFGPYLQSQRRPVYLAIWKKLRSKGLIYPCSCSRRDILQAISAPHPEDEEPIYPGTCRPKEPSIPPGGGLCEAAESQRRLPPGGLTEGTHKISPEDPAGVTWRFRVPEGLELSFEDGRLGPHKAVAGRDFGDFIVWRKDDIPSYQLAVVADDAAMKITEVVRGEDLLLSTFRQLLLYQALELPAPAFYHCPLVRDEHGARLAKRNAALSLRQLRESAKWEARSGKS